MKVQYNKQPIDFKFILNIISLVGAVVWGWYEMESRITAVEMQIETMGRMKTLQDEINRIKTEQQFAELK